MKKRRKPDFISLKEKDKENCRSNSLKINGQPKLETRQGPAREIMIHLLSFL